MKLWIWTAAAAGAAALALTGAATAGSPAGSPARAAGEPVARDEIRIVTIDADADAIELDSGRLIAELEAMVKEGKLDRKTLEAVRQRLAQRRRALFAAPRGVPPITGNADFLRFHALPALGLPDVRLDLDLENAQPKEALRQIFERSKVEYTLDDDIPDEPRITLKAKSVRLRTALALVTEAAGVSWLYEVRNDRRSVRVGKSVRSRDATLFVPDGIDVNVLERIEISRGSELKRSDVPTAPPPVATFYGAVGARSTFVCPHCKGRSAVIRVQEQPRCPKCERLFQPEWRFCPADGSRRPQSPGGWRYCPLCGKQVEPAGGKE